MTDTQLAALGVEVLTTGAPDTRLAALAVEVLTTGAPDTRVASLAIEVLTPRIVPRRGWGIPMTPTS